MSASTDSVPSAVSSARPRPITAHRGAAQKPLICADRAAAQIPLISAEPEVAEHDSSRTEAITRGRFGSPETGSQHLVIRPEGLPPVALSSRATGRMGDLLQVLGQTPPNGADNVLVPLRSVRAGVTLIHAGLSPSSLHVVRLGAFKTQVVCDDGYEQVTGFPGPSEILGLDGLQGERHTFSAIALEDSAVYSLSLRELDDLRQRFPPLDHAMQRAVSRQLAEAAQLAQVMSAVSSEARLARFLLQRSRRMALLGQSSTRLRLPMSRRDIASHLGVAHETVSRSLGELSQWGCLRVQQREIELMDLDRLQSLARNTRGPLASPAL